MNIQNCIYLIPEGQSKEGTATIYYCLAGKTVLTEEDLQHEWACAGCRIPDIIAAEPCLYLEPGKHFFTTGESLLVLKCNLKEEIISDIGCCRQCASFTRTVTG